MGGRGKKRKEKREKEMKRWCTWVVEKKRKEKRKKKFNKVMIKTKSKNQNYIPNTIFFFLNCDFSCETKTMYQTNFFLQS